MGNELTKITLAKELENPTTGAEIKKQFENGGSYYEYLILKHKAESACSSVFIAHSRYHQEKCVELEIAALMMKISAKSKTKGMVDILES